MPFLTALFDLNGTATRKQALRVFVLMLAGLGIVMLMERTVPAYTRFVVPVVGLVQVWWWATVVRRLHDAGHSGAWAVLLPLPIVGLLGSVVVLVPRSDRSFNDSHVGLRLAGSVGLVLVAILALTRLFWAPYWVPSEAMKPTLLVGDYLVVRHDEMADLTRGDLVVFRHPVTGEGRVDRLIGLPGDTIRIRGGRVELNGQALVQEPAGMLRETYAPQGPQAMLPRCFNAVVGVGGVCEKQLWQETLPEGRRYTVANIEDGAFADDIGPFTVPEGQMFLLGDNRDNAADSRFAQGAGGLGFVPAENVIGRATRVIYSTEGRSLWAVWDWRGDRMFRSVE
jgi:signal peptidase I